MPEPLRSARPNLRVSDQDRPELSAGLLALAVREDALGLSQLEACFSNWGSTSGGPGHLYFDGRVLDFGKVFEVLLGDQRLFRGRVTGIEGGWFEERPPEITVLAEDRLQDLRMTRRSRTFEHLSDQEILQRIAADHGLRLEGALPGPSYEQVSQLNLSDLAFARERAARAGAELWVDGEELHVATRSARSGASPVTLSHGSELMSFEVLADLAHQCTSLAVSGWDPEGKEAVSHSADAAALAMAGDRSGAEILGSALGPRAQRVVHTMPLRWSEARAEAEALFRQRARRFVVGRGRAHPDARLRVGRAVRLEGLGPWFSGVYTLSEVVHRFDQERGFRAEFVAEREGLGRSS